MDRRGFLKFLGAGVAGIALEQAIPLGRVWSFPSKLVLPERDHYYTRAEELERKFRTSTAVGSTIRINMPQHYYVRDFLSG